jgi:hypothetical protein
MRDLMIIKTAAALALVLTPCLLKSGGARAQDVPGIEICTVEKTMERRTSCLQSNVNFLQQTIAKLSSDSQQRLDAANRQIDTLKSAVASLQKRLDEVQAAQNKPKDVAPQVLPASPPKEGAK